MVARLSAKPGRSGRAHRDSATSQTPRVEAPSPLCTWSTTPSRTDTQSAQVEGSETPPTTSSPEDFSSSKWRIRNCNDCPSRRDGIKTFTVSANKLGLRTRKTPPPRLDVKPLSRVAGREDGDLLHSVPLRGPARTDLMAQAGRDENESALEATGSRWSFPEYQVQTARFG